MAQCPNCSKNLAITEDNFGTLYRCEHCQAEFFIGFDGVPENSKEPIPGDEPAPSHPEIPNTPIEPVVSMDFTTMPEPNSSSSDLFNISQPSDQQSIEPHATKSPGYSMPESMSAPEPMTMPDPEMSMAAAPEKKSAFQDFANDVQNFGNDTSTTGVLSFDIEISGIDLADTKKDLLEALDDQRFGWNLEDVSQKISNGSLKLENVSAPKIIVLVKRIAPMGLTLNWRHHVSTQ